MYCSPGWVTHNGQQLVHARARVHTHTRVQTNTVLIPLEWLLCVTKLNRYHKSLTIINYFELTITACNKF